MTMCLLHGVLCCLSYGQKLDCCLRRFNAATVLTLMNMQVPASLATKAFISHLFQLDPSRYVSTLDNADYASNERIWGS